MSEERVVNSGLCGREFCRSEMDGNKMKGIPMQSVKVCGGVEVDFYSFLTSVLDGSVYRHGALTFQFFPRT